MSNVDDIERLRLLIDEEVKLKSKIEKLSTYEVDMIEDIISKLISAFELDFVSKIELENGNKNMCFLPPSGYLDIVSTTSPVMTDFTCREYVQNFIDYLYEIRSKEMLFDISKERLEIILSEFLEKNKNKPDQNSTNKEDFLIDRNSIFNAITYIINNCEEDMSAIQEKYSEWYKTKEWSTLIVYHKLSIKSGDVNACFITEVDKDGRFPDEEKDAVVSYGKCTYISYFELKRVLFPVLKNSHYSIMLMDLIEEKYDDTRLLTANDVDELLSLIKNYKQKESYQKKKQRN